MQRNFCSSLFRRRHIICLCLLGTWIGGRAAVAVEQDAIETGRDFFVPTEIWKLRLEISAGEYEAMQPPPPAGFGPPGTPAVPQTRPAGLAKRESERNLFGTEFPWAQAELQIGQETLKNIGVRYAGEITYFMSAQGLKRPFKLQFDRFQDQSYQGLRSLQLHAMPMEPSKCREAIAYGVFRAAGVPAQRTTYAEVTLHVTGRHEEQYLGLYTVVESVDLTFLNRRFGNSKGLLMNPFQVRSFDDAGAEWDQYVPRYRPMRPATKEQAQRTIDFARLINRSSDEEFQKKLDEYLDVNQFLRYLAGTALTSNLESSVSLGHNYAVYLEPTSNRFVFIPGDLEFSLGNFLLMGTGEQLADLSLIHPYPGENKLVERILALPGAKEKYFKLIQELAKSAFSGDTLITELNSYEAAIEPILAKEKNAAEARQEPTAGFGPPGAAPPQPPKLASFVALRTESIARQLEGKGSGYVPAGFGFGPGAGPPGGGPGGSVQPIDERTFRDVVKASEGFQSTLFAAPPQLGYPVAIAVAPNGDVFVAVDEQGSIGRNQGGGKVMRCVDRDGDGKADDITVFARMEHPRGLIFQDDSLWVLHPPFLSVYHDSGTGEADRSDVLVTGLTSHMIDERGGDHTTNGIRMGIDGWIYIAVGDYGCPRAEGKDGSRVTMRGGIVRVRPDGTHLEIFATGLRNPFDLGIDPYMNLFTRDNNDNRSGGWDIRVIHLIQSAYYGYSQHYANFPEETMPPLGQFGAGSGTGTLYLQNPRWPEEYQSVLLTSDWGRNEVYVHRLTPHGPTFDLQQNVFLTIPRPTGIDLDADGRLYVCSWRGGEASNYVGPNVGFVARITPGEIAVAPKSDLHLLDLSHLVEQLTGPNQVARLQAQRELLRRGNSLELQKALKQLMFDTGARLEGRAAAIFTWKQLAGRASHPSLITLLQDPLVSEFAMRALTDRKDELGDLDHALFIDALQSPSPRVRAQAIISLGRLDARDAAGQLVPLTMRPEGSAMPVTSPVHAQPDADRVLPHLAIRTLIQFGASAECLKALDGPHRDGVLLALRSMHDSATVEGLIQRLAVERSTERRREILSTLVRLSRRETDFSGVWWGIRPENSGPYFDPIEWEESGRIDAVVRRAVQDADPDTASFLRQELARHRVTIEGLRPVTATGATSIPEDPVVVPQTDPSNPNQIGNMAYQAVMQRALRANGDVSTGKRLFKTQSCVNCHTDADGQSIKGPHLVDIGKRYKAEELLESILKPSNKIAQGFETYAFEMIDGRTFIGFVVSQGGRSVSIREANGLPRELKLADIESKTIQKQSNMPEGIVNNLTPEELSHLVAYLKSLTVGAANPPAVEAGRN